MGTPDPCLLALEATAALEAVLMALHAVETPEANEFCRHLCHDCDDLRTQEEAIRPYVEAN